MRLIFEFVKELSGQYEVHVLTSIASWAKDVASWEEDLGENWGVRLHTVSFKHLYFSPLRMVFSRLLLLGKALLLFRRFDYDVVQEFSSAPLLTYGSWIIKKLTGAKVFHCILGFNQSPLAGFGVKKVAKLDGVVFTSREFFKDFASNKNVSYRPLGLDVGNLQSWSREHTYMLEYQCRKEVVYLGPIESRKGVFVLVQAIKNMPEIFFKMYTYGMGGVDADHQGNRRLLEDILSGYSNYKIFEGIFSSAEVICKSDFFVMPNVSLHGTMTPPTTLLEAMYLKRVCLVSDVRGMGEVVSDGVDGLLFRKGEASDLQGVLNRAFKLGPEEKRLMGEGAQWKVVNDYNLNNFVKASRGDYEAR